MKKIPVTSYQLPVTKFKIIPNYYRAIFILLVLFLNTISSSSAQTGNLFYYAFDDKIDLNPVTNKFTVEFIDSENEQSLIDNNLTHTKISGKVYEVSGDLIQIIDAKNF